MANIRHSRRPTGYVPVDVGQARLNFIASVICDAVLIAKGERSASDYEIAQCKLFLQSDKCARWLDFLNFPHDCLKRII